MAELTKKEMLRIVEENISRLKNKDFNLYFFVIVKGALYNSYQPEPAK